MNNKKFNKLIFSLILCVILNTDSISSNAEQINVEKNNFELGISCLKQNDFKQAIKYFELVVQKNPKNIEALYNLALAYKKAGMTEKYVSEFEKVVKLVNDPQNFRAKDIDINKLRQESRVLHDNELASDKFALYAKVKSKENDYIDMGDIHYDNQQFETAVEYYNLALQINPYNDYTYFKIAQSYIDAGNYIQAEPYISRAVELNPQNPKYIFSRDSVVKNIGTKSVKNNDLKSKSKLINKSLNKKDPIQGFDLSGEYKRELFADEEKKLTKNTPEPVVKEKITSPAGIQSDVKISEKHNQKQNIVKSVNPIFPPQKTENMTTGKSQELDYLDLADLHYDNQEFDTAKEYYTLALKINPNNDYSYYKLARCYLDMHQYKNADEYINKALAMSSMNKKYLYFKNEIGNNLNPGTNSALSYKEPETLLNKRTQELYTGKVIKLNPNLKMIAEDPKIISDEVSAEPDFPEVKLPAREKVKQKHEKNISYFDKLKAAFTKATKENPEKIAVNQTKIQPVKNKKVDKPEKLNIKVAKSGETLEKIKNIDVSGQQITSGPDSSAIFGKDMNYYRTKEPAVTKTLDVQYEKPMQEQVKEPEYSPDYYNEKGIEYFKRDNFEKAENFFKKAIELNPKYAKAYNNLANIEVRRDNPDKATEYALQAVTIDPTYPESYYNLALIYKKKKDYVNEMSYLDQTIKADPNFRQAYFTRGTAYNLTGNYEQAKYNFKEVLKLKNDHYLATQNLGIIYADELNKPEAENYLKTAIRLNKNNPDSYYYLATVYQTTGSVSDAIENYRKTIELDPANYKAHLALSKSYDQNNEIDKAIDTINGAVRLNPANAEPYNYLGLLYLKKDKYIEATNAFQKAVAINPARPVYHYNLSQSYICLNMKNKAETEFEKAVNITPANIQDYIDLSEIFYDRKMPSYSIKVLKDGIAALPGNDYLYVVLSNFYEKTGAVISAKKLLSDYLVLKPNGTLSLLIKRKLNSFENADETSN